MSISRYPSGEVFEGHTLNDIAIGNVPGLSLFPGFATGTISSTEFSTVWGFSSSYIRPSAEEGFTVVSTSANDTLAGTGARVIAVPFLHDDGNLEVELVVLNGTTPVNSVSTQARRILTPTVVNAGTGEANDGDITLVGTTSGLNLSFMPENVGGAHDAVRAIPLGVEAFVHGAEITVVDVDKVATVRLLIGEFDTPLRERKKVSIVEKREYIPIEKLVAEKSDLVVEAKIASGQASIQIDPVIILIGKPRLNKN